MTLGEIDDTPAPTEELEDIMPSPVTCRKCQAEGHTPPGRAEITFRQLQGVSLELRGLLRCLCDRCDGDRWPITMREEEIIETAPSLPVSEAERLSSNICNTYQGLVEDVEEAETAHFAQNYKSSAVMCRRALQLAFEDRLTAKQVQLQQQETLGTLLGIVKNTNPISLASQFITYAERVKDFGNEGAHSRVGHLEPSDVAVVIHDTVVILNELYK